MLFIVHQVTKPPLGLGEEERQSIEGHSVRGSKNPVCQVLWYFVSEEMGSHFPPEGLQTKAKVPLKILRHLLRCQICLSTDASAPLSFYFKLRGQEDTLLCGCEGHNQVNTDFLKRSKGEECVYF